MVEIRDQATARPPATSAGLLRLFDKLGIPTTTVSHPAVFTVEQAKTLCGDLPGTHCKNLFLRDAKGQLWLVVAREDTQVDLRALAGKLGSKRLSFVRADLLMDVLGVIPGAVTPFAVVNDHRGLVKTVLDRALLAEARLNFHPLDNAMTTTISSRDLLHFLESTGHAPLIVDL